jgi:hypothetical protein
MLRAMLKSPTGRDILANAITAGAGAAAAVLIEQRKEIKKAGRKGLRKGGRRHWHRTRCGAERGDCRYGCRRGGGPLNLAGEEIPKGKRTGKGRRHTLKRVPHARTGLPRSLERRLLKPYADTLFGRIWSAGALRSISVLVRHHPRAALHVVGSGVLEAGKASLEEVTHVFGSGGEKSITDEQTEQDDANGSQVAADKE